MESFLLPHFVCSSTYSLFLPFEYCSITRKHFKPANQRLDIQDLILPSTPAAYADRIAMKIGLQKKEHC